jgi:hypothetical protein
VAIFFDYGKVDAIHQENIIQIQNISTVQRKLQQRLGKRDISAIEEN